MHVLQTPHEILVQLTNEQRALAETWLQLSLWINSNFLELELLERETKNVCKQNVNVLIQKSKIAIEYK